MEEFDEESTEQEFGVDNDNDYVESGSEGEELLDESNTNAETSTRSNATIWTESALDVLIAIMHELIQAKKTFRLQREKWEHVEGTMAHRGFSFTSTQIHNKWKNLRKMFLKKKRRNEPIEPELESLFENNLEYEEFSNPSSASFPAPPPVKRTKYSTDHEQEDDANSSKTAWGEEATKLLLSLLREVKPQVGVSDTFRSKKQMWEYISSQIAQHGYTFSPSQIENKWKSLVRTYRKRMEKSPGLRMQVGSSKNDSTNASWSDAQEEEETTHSPTKDEQQQIEETSQDYGIEPIVEVNYEPIERKPIAPIPIQVTENLPIIENITTDQEKNSIAQEIALTREQTSKFELEKIKLKKAEIEAYKDRTKEFVKIGTCLSDLLTYFRSKE